MTYQTMIPLPEVFELHELPPEFATLSNIAPMLRNPGVLAEAQRIASELLAKREQMQGLPLDEAAHHHAHVSRFTA